jgi:hypothetical protein
MHGVIIDLSAFDAFLFVQAKHCVAPAIRVAITGKTNELAASERCAVEVT